MAESGTEAVVRDAIRRFDADAPAEDLFAADYVRTGVPVPFLRATTTAKGQAAALHEAAVLRWHEPFETGGEHALVMGTWSHRGEASGSAGLFWAVIRVRDGRITEVHYHQDEASARNALRA